MLDKIIYQYSLSFSCFSTDKLSQCTLYFNMINEGTDFSRINNENGDAVDRTLRRITRSNSKQVSTEMFTMLFKLHFRISIDIASIN